MENSLRQIKYIGGIGAILVLLTIVPYFGFLTHIAGKVLLIIAFYKLSSILKNKYIFSKYLTGFVISLMGIMIALISGIGFSLLFITKNKPTVQSMSLGVIAGIIIFWLILIISSYYYSRSYKLLGKHFDLELFNLAANFVMWGGITAIILIGFILFFVSGILMAIAFWHMPERIIEEQRTI
ncbi:MAG: DUF996 domain-containing protein [Candidatus Omnitrophica bacterium]|nr:DUF996 domain-containing protein [Candidatus Omnitrophota bacterium]